MKISDLALAMFQGIAPQYSHQDLKERCATIECFYVCQPCNLLRFTAGKFENEFCENCQELMLSVTEESLREFDEEFACEGVH